MSVMRLRGSAAKPPAQDQESLGAKDDGAGRGSIWKVRPDRSGQSRDAESYGHKKPEGCPDAGAQPNILMAAYQEYSRGQQLPPTDFHPAPTNARTDGFTEIAIPLIARVPPDCGFSPFRSWIEKPTPHNCSSQLI